MLALFTYLGLLHVFLIGFGFDRLCPGIVTVFGPGFLFVLFGTHLTLFDMFCSFLTRFES